MTLRRMVVVRSPSTNNRPEIRISNSFLLLTGFKVGTPIEVCYQQDRIIITKLSTQHAKLQKPVNPLTVSAASGQASAGACDGHAERAQPSATNTTEALPNAVQPAGYLLAGHYNHVGT